jgi:hypothetical protein
MKRQPFALPYAGIHKEADLSGNYASAAPVEPAVGDYIADALGGLGIPREQALKLGSAFGLFPDGFRESGRALAAPFVDPTAGNIAGAGFEAALMGLPAVKGVKAVADDAAKGVRKIYHGSPHLFDELDTSNPAWLTTTPHTAQRFAVDRAEYGGYQNRAHAQALQNDGKIHVYEAELGGRVLDHDPMAEAIATARKAGIPEPETWDDAAEILRWADYQREVIDRAKQDGFDAVRFLNVGDDPMGEVSDHIAVLNANAISGFKRQEPQKGGDQSAYIAELMKMLEPRGGK